MTLVAAATIWGLFSCYLLFPLAGLPAYMHRIAMGLLVAELIALGIWSYGIPSWIVDTGRAAAGLDIPLSGIGLVAVAVIWGLSRRAEAAEGTTRGVAPSSAAALEHLAAGDPADELEDGVLGGRELRHTADL